MQEEKRENTPEIATMKPEQRIILLIALTSRSVTAFAVTTRLSQTVPVPTTRRSKVLTPPPTPPCADDEQSSFVAWPQPLVASHGDYRDEAFLEHRIGGPLYSKQQELPRLPIPSLEETMNRFIPTALPLTHNSEETKTLLEDCRRFPDQARVLQERLLQRQAETEDSSWLQQLWQTKGYLQVRDPVCVKVSYFLFVPNDDDTLPVIDADDGDSKVIHRAAALLVAMAQSRQQICSGNMPYETIPHRDGQEEPLCSTGFKYLFHSCRIPTKQQDMYHLYDPSHYHHCIVACRGQFFALNFCDQKTGEILPLFVLEQRLQHCVDMTTTTTNKDCTTNLPQLGWLTSTDRDFWANARQELLQVGGNPMKEAFAKLESGAFVLNLDVDDVSIYIYIYLCVLELRYSKKCVALILI